MKKSTNYKKILENFFIKKEGQSIKKSLNKINLIKSGMLDSMDILNLALFISKKFNIKVDISNEKNLKAFEKFDHILKLIKKKK
tara:strand:+ start:153 stop:404 length:252 start_codon:yes stop_codon:yes gene_type:complete